ncbi:dihydropteroate synthase [Mesorhizobium sp. M1A.F.Ca.IN.022.04.1.1]|uniref:dihydropteroate synthase n=1 Tax=Mesorhizobium sp. M1A.F.Ca.IN.022.04.1.1 TaxID=2496773 RepID=UPI000FCB5C05|nr:dihydropteroate synthase [Mesorhizobium sp. M1A.F.Ca.IN.022.04.1.1]RUV17651.1 hypothetical protein EOA91_18930 [Mesorhizobium sp. M1A.F.Ca.IN.022.04.1.1]
MTTRRWQLAHGRHLDLGPKSVVVGILNVTPDSFSDGGLFIAPEKAIAQARRMAEEGAAIIDIGGESTRPGFAPISAEEEQTRVLPVIEALAASGEALISVDTYREDTARRAVAAGAHIVNDVWGLQREPAERAVGTAATSIILRLKGADLFRVHDVAINVDALAMADAMLAREKLSPGR